jgi:hypothetical protein
MRSKVRLASGWIFFGTLALLMAWCSVSPSPARAQTPGNNAVYNTSGGPTWSGAFIDATAVPQGTDICNTLYNIMNGANPYPPYPPGGAVIDARGFDQWFPACTSGTPWQQTGVGTVNKPSVILLPPHRDRH